MKLDCATCGPELAPYAAGDGDPEIRSAVAAHAAECPACRRELAREHELRAALAGLPLVTCPTAVTGRVLAAIALRRADVRRRRWFAGIGTAAAAAALALAMLARPGASPTQPADAATARANTAPAPYTTGEIAAARQDLIRTMTLTASILDKAGRYTIADVFSERLPAAVAGSLRPLDDPTRGG
jgi:anti-sigma factor RsiW